MNEKECFLNYWWSITDGQIKHGCLLALLSTDQAERQSASRLSCQLVLPGGKTQNKGGRAKRNGTKGARHHLESLYRVHCTLVSIFNVRGINYQIHAGELSWLVCNWGETQKGGRDNSELGNLTREGQVRMARVSVSFTHTAFSKA